MQLPESASFKLLEKYGIPTASWKFARTLEEALIEVENMYFPLVLKADGVVSRRETGCFRTVYESSQFEKAFEAVAKNARKQKSSGIILQEYVRSDTQDIQELLLGIKRSNNRFKLMIGAGGKLIGEKDIQISYLPLAKPALMALFRKTKISNVIEKPERLVDVISKMSRLAEFEHVSEIEINPIFVYDRIASAGVNITVNLTPVTAK